MTAAPFLRHPSFTGSVAVQPTAGRTCAVRLIDRRTGAAHRINGTPLVIYTRRPAEAAAELLQGRDPLIWEARVDAIETETR